MQKKKSHVTINGLQTKRKIQFMQKIPFEFLNIYHSASVLLHGGKLTYFYTNGAKHFPARERAQRYFQAPKVSKFEFIQQKFKR